MSKTAPKKTRGPIVLTSPTEEAEIEKVELFSIDGKSYFVDRHVPANVTLKFMRKSKTDQNEAGYYLLTTLLGQEGYEALENWDGLTTEILKRIMDAAASLMVDEEDQD